MHKSKIEIIEEIKNNYPLNSNIKDKISYFGKIGLFAYLIEKFNTGTAFRDLCEMYEKIGYQTLDISILISSFAHMLGSVFPLNKFQNNDILNQVLNNSINGTEISSIAITEKNEGSNISQIKSEAVDDENNIIINAEKHYVTNATIADWFLIFCKYKKRITGILLNKKDIGVKEVKPINITGLKKSPIGVIKVENCKISKTRIIGGDKYLTFGGNTILQYCFEIERAFIFSGLLGIMQFQLEEAKRIIKEKKLYSSQSINRKIVEMKINYDISKLIIFDCAQRKDNGKRITLQSSEAKLITSNAFHKNSATLVQIAGAAGLLTEKKYSDWVLDSLACKILAGTNEIQENIIGSLFGTYVNKSKN